MKTNNLLQTVTLSTLFIIAVTLMFCKSNIKETNNVISSFSNHLAEYNNIVTDLKTKDIPLGKLKKYKIEDFSNTATIEILPDDHFSNRGMGEGDIWVFVTENNFIVFIETKDKGHAGEYGLAYSENGEAPVWNHDEWGEFWTLDKQINDNWWKISFRLG